MGEKHGSAVGRIPQGRRWSAGGRDGSCTWILGPRQLIKVCMTTLQLSFCLHQAMGRAVATGAAATEITGSAQGSGTSETLSPLMGGDRASRTPLPATLTLQCPGRPRLPKQCRQGIMAPPRRESELCQGERGRTPGRGWAGGPEGQAPPGPEPGAPPSGASSWLLPPGAQGGKFQAEHITRGPLLRTHQTEGPRAPSPRPQAPSRTSRVRRPRTCTSSQTGCSAGKEARGQGESRGGRQRLSPPTHWTRPLRLPPCLDAP